MRDRSGAVWARSGGLWILLLAFLLGGCDKPDWLEQFERRMDAAVPKLEQALEDIAESLPAAMDRLDDETAARVAEFDRLLQETIDGLSDVLAENRGRVDAVLTARVEQLAAAAEAFAKDLGRISKGLQDDITVSVDNLLARTDQVGVSLLVSLDLAAASVEQQGDAVVASAYRIFSGLVLKVTGGVLIAVGLVGGGIAILVIVRRRGGGRIWTQYVPVAGAVVVIVLGIVALTSPRVRAWLLEHDVIIDHDRCPSALAGGLSVLSRLEGSSGPPTAEVVGQASAALTDLMACRALTTALDPHDRASQFIARIRRALGFEDGCLRNRDCPPRERCDVYSAKCTSSCQADGHCARTGEICHADFGLCAPVCRGTGAGTCPENALCDDRGRCVRPTPEAGPGDVLPGGAGWSRLKACATKACLNVGPAVRLRKSQLAPAPTTAGPSGPRAP